MDRANVSKLATEDVLTACAFFRCYSTISLSSRCDLGNQFSFRLQSSFRYSYSMSLRLALKATQEQAGELSILYMWLKLTSLTTSG